LVGLAVAGGVNVHVGELVGLVVTVAVAVTGV